MLHCMEIVLDSHQVYRSVAAFGVNNEAALLKKNKKEYEHMVSP